MKTNSLSTKPHYAILDGLRGVAALMVVAFHLCEAHATSHQDQIINHGYLAVDFFFLLSGFVIGYAYDDRWGKMTIGNFFKRRLIRLQPMVVMGSIIGAVCYYFQSSGVFPIIGQTPVWQMLLIMVIGCTMLPIPPSMDIRGWAETYPLNGPAWSLFYEYVVNIFYALVARKLSKTVLSILVILSAGALIHLAVNQGDVIGGWSLNAEQMRIGFCRVMFPFFGGLLLFRIAKLRNIKNAFVWSSLLTIIVLAAPRIGTTENLWMNGLYDSLSIVLIFPLIIFLGASGEIQSAVGKKICKFLGDISYPIYITHYPLIYTYTAWVFDKKIPLKEAYPITILVFIAAVAIAYACLKWYDEPVRAWLNKRAKAPVKVKHESEVEAK
ncbi:acyltransferase family protein [Pinibacter aurantiacus]|uniref:Acyltransferase n=1 Tax=Pinibacter aurantiacus TaxID=2851599 RepID=A0A9E2W805_9BACT|nr:acyltransferase [Pinibacter aurantiacus]MBV4357616.1 acyltransferase [Pinibacter aurantiacus]